MALDVELRSQMTEGQGWSRETGAQDYYWSLQWTGCLCSFQTCVKS